jgi:uncharacterized protein YjbI with pentapeptide repeats
MANSEQLERLKKGVEGWNKWREEHPEERVDLGKADLRGEQLAEANLAEANLAGAHLKGAHLERANLKHAILAGADLNAADLRQARLTIADLRRAQLTYARLWDADLRHANLSAADLSRADLSRADLLRAKLSGASIRNAIVTEARIMEAVLTGADLTEANLWKANLTAADFTKADLSRAVLKAADLSFANLRQAKLSGADLTESTLVEARLEGADLEGCRVYGISAWDVHLDDTKQQGLVITPEHAAEITVDDLEVAQFIYLLLNNEKIRKVIDTVTSKVVLILGRFTHERKAVLDALRDRLRTRDLTPVIFDFTNPASKDMTGTVETLARMARLVVADLTDPSSIPHELATVVPFLRTTPVVLLRLAGATGYSMVKDLEAYAGWVLPVREYPNPLALIDGIDDYVILPAEAKLRLLRPDNPTEWPRTPP